MQPQNSRQYLRIKGDKMTKKQIKLGRTELEKLTQISIHLQALFSAVEHGHLEKARTILESTDIDINSLNGDGLSPLDVAVLSNNRPMTKMLLQHGAMERSQFHASDSLGNQLNELLEDAENRVQELSNTEIISQPPLSTRSSFSSIIGNSGSSVTACAGTEADRQLGIWERRVKGLKRMLLGWDQARPPDMPTSATVDVTGLTSVTLCVLEPNEGALCTKFQIQWSTRADFSNILGERYLYEWSSYQGIMGATCKINDLTQGRKYFFRASCGNVKGWGPFRQSVPFSVIPSSWRDASKKESRFVGRQLILDELFAAVCLSRPEGASVISLDVSAIQRKNPKKKATIKQLFSAPAKFQKNLRRGIYLASILYYDDRILVTNEDFLPVVEIDETYPSSLNSDFLWFMKVACTWNDVKSLRGDMEKNSISTIHFRMKLLAAAYQMQSALSTVDLGQLYYKPLKDCHGTVVLCTVNMVKNTKSISVLNSRWISLRKIQKRVTSLHADNSINEILINSINEQIRYNQTSIITLPRGLYLGYLKMQSSVDQIQVVVPLKTPNVLPHCKIRDNPHISAEEWEILKRDKLISSMDFAPKSDGNMEIQKIFLESLTTASSRLFNYMNIITSDALTHRLYDVEVIELSCDVSFLVVCPPTESSCAVPGQQEILLQRGDLISLPVQTFEMIQLKTYQSNIIQKYSRLSCILELDTALANHLHREAFSNSEIKAAKDKLLKLQELTTKLNSVWRSVRWLMDVIAFMRDKGSISGITIKEILELSKIEVINNAFNTGNNQQLLQLPNRNGSLIKGTPGRGSWPGPIAGLASNTFLAAEYSRSEQSLGFSLPLNKKGIGTQSTVRKIESSSRKSSTDSQSGISYFSAGETVEPVTFRLPPSRSEDTLVRTRKHSEIGYRKRSTTTSMNLSVTSSPHLTHKSTYDSLQSLSSDSEASMHSFVLTANKLKAKIKLDNEELKEKGQNFLRPTLTVRSEIKLSKEAVHTSEPSSSMVKSSSKYYRKSMQQSSDAEDFSVRLDNCKTSRCNQHSGIIQVYAAYETGLAQGTSLKLHVTPKTTAREVVDLVVKQLNMAVVLKGKDGPIYTTEKLENFCLVAVIGARERCLRDDFKPLQLQNPWKKGRLFVRQKHDLLAAIGYSNKDSHLI